MKNLIALLTFILSIQASAQNNVTLTGAWQTGSEEKRIVMICSEKFFTASVYDLKNKTFIGTCGGTYKIEGNSFVEVHEFNTMQPDYIGKELKGKVEIKGSKLFFPEEKENQEWTCIDDGTPGQLAGAWLITARMQDNAMQKMTPGARRTMKILSGTRFQWIAYNVETKEFFGTGGGTYSTKDGKYVEAIDFFSRDNSRVGANLTFDFSLDQGNWRHRGFSSKGDPIDEVWTKREQLGL